MGCNKQFNTGKNNLKMFLRRFSAECVQYIWKVFAPNIKRLNYCKSSWNQDFIGYAFRISQDRAYRQEKRNKIFLDDVLDTHDTIKKFCIDNWKNCFTKGELQIWKKLITILHAEYIDDCIQLACYYWQQISSIHRWTIMKISTQIYLKIG